MTTDSNRKSIPLVGLLAFGLIQLGAAPSADAQLRDRGATLVVDGQVDGLYRGDDGFLVQILVQGSQVPSLDQAGGVRYPAPGEYVYVHVTSASERIGSRAGDLPELRSAVRAYLQLGPRNRWETGGADWYEALSDNQLRRPADRTAGGEREGATSLGIVAERTRLRFSTALKVVRVEPASPAAQAGIEVGDILLKADDKDLAFPEQLDEVFRDRGGSVTLTVHDVRTGRDVPVEVTANGVSVNEQPRRGNPEPLGVKTELAFYSGAAALKVTEVDRGSPADRAGIKPGLLILKVDGESLESPEDLAAAERGSGPMQLIVVDPEDRREQTVRISR